VATGAGAALAAALAACGGGGGADRQAGAATPTAEADASVALPVRGQAELLTMRAVPVRIAPRGSHDAAVRIVTAVRSGGSRPAVAARTVHLRRGRARTVAIGLSPSQAALLAGCSTATLSARAGGARARVAVGRQPPVCGSFFAPTSVWNSPLPADARLDPASDAVTASLLAQVREAYARNFGPTINTTSFSAPIYTVSASQPRVGVVLDRRETWARPLARVLRSGIPIPPGARPAAGTDRHLVVWQPATDTMWELWKAQRRVGTWHASFGGRMRRVSRNPGWFAPIRGVETGATATSLPLAGGLMTPTELRAGHIDHALALAIPRIRSGTWSLPARRTDGGDDAADAVPAGAHFRLDPSLDVEALDAPPVVKAMARAAQRYGLIVRDTSATVTLYAQDPTPTGTDPYPALFGAGPLASLLRSFPWDRLQLLALQLRTYRH
jgi:hypothetical protein